MKTAKMLQLLVFATMFCTGSAFAGENTPVIIFDQGHNQRFLIEEKGDLQLSKFADVAREQGAKVASVKEPFTDALLKDVTALIISGPFEALKPEEIDAVTRFVEKGGRLSLMLHIGPPLAALLSRLDLDHSNAVLHERQNVIDKDINFRVSNLSDSKLFAGVTHFSLYGGWALNPGGNGVAIAKTSKDAWADLDGNKELSKGDAVEEFNVVVTGKLGDGSFVVFGDDAIFQNRYLDENNGRLAANLAGWLTGK